MWVIKSMAAASVTRVTLASMVDCFPHLAYQSPRALHPFFHFSRDAESVSVPDPL